LGIAVILDHGSAPQRKPHGRAQRLEEPESIACGVAVLGLTLEH